MTGNTVTVEAASAPSADLTGLAVALGRIEQSQTDVKEGMGRVEKKVDGVAETVASHSIQIAQTATRVDTDIMDLATFKTYVDEKFKAIAPAKVQWTSVGAFIVAATGFAFVVAQYILA